MVPDPFMLRFRSALDAAFDAHIACVVLFGSRVRGNHRQDSDYYVAVCLRDEVDFSRQTSILSDIEIDTDFTISALPLGENALHERTIFMANLLRDGVDL